MIREKERRAGRGLSEEGNAKRHERPCRDCAPRRLRRGRVEQRGPRRLDRFVGGVRVIGDCVLEGLAQAATRKYERQTRRP